MIVLCSMKSIEFDGLIKFVAHHEPTLATRLKSSWGKDHAREWGEAKLYSKRPTSISILHVH